MTPADVRGFRLSPQQRRLWALAEAGGGACRAVALVRIGGTVTAGGLAAAAGRAAARHEVLRTVFRCPRDMRLPVQVILPGAAIPVLPLDPPAGLPDDAAPGRWIGEALRAPFTPAEGPLVRAGLLTGEDTSWLLLSASALCLDGAGVVLLAREIARELAGSLSGETAEEPLQYADLAEWQNAALEGEDGAAGREVWARQRAAAPPPAELPWSLPETTALAPVEATVPLEPGLAAALLRHAAAAEQAPGILLLAAWAVLLGRLTGQPRGAVGMLFAGRHYEELEGALGTFARILPLTLPAAAGEPLTEAVRAAAGAVREAAAWQECFAWEQVAGPDDLALPPPFLSFAFSWEDAEEAWTAGGVRWEVVRRTAYTDRFRVLFQARAAPEGGLDLSLHYDPASLDAGGAARLAERLATLLADVARRGLAVAGGELELVGEEESRLLMELAVSAPAPPAGRCLHQMFEEQARRRPDALAVVGGERLTAAELGRRANRLAHHLRRLGVGPEVPVAIFLDRTATFVVGLLAVLKAGGCYVPLDPGQPSERLAFLLADSGAAAVLTGRSLLGSLPPGTTAVTLVLDAAAPGTEPWAGESERDPEGGAEPANAAYAIYTSGSTGTPKRVIVEHRQLTAYVQAVLDRLGLPEGASFATVSTFAADLGHTAVFPALATGGTLHVVGHDEATSPEALADRFTAEPVDCLKIVPSHLRALLRGSRPEALLPRRRLVLGGEAAGRDLLAELADLSSHAAPGLEIFNHYGPTETTVGALAGRLDPDVQEGAVPPLGRPLPGARVYLLSAGPDGGLRLTPAGVPGEVFLGGCGVSRGYGGLPGLTAERFVPDPFHAGERLYRTGDLARWLSGGALEFLGRRDDQVKIHGFRIEPGEVAAALARHPAVAEAAVVARTEGGGAMLAAYLVAGAGLGPVPPGELRDFLRGRLPEPMIPAAWIWLPALPLTANGKLDRRALPAPERTGAEYAAPRRREEEVLARVWQEVLGIERVGIHDNFFELGGDSILSIQIIARAARFGLRFTPKQVFQHQTVAALIAVAGEGDGIAAEQGEVTGAVPLTPIQLRFFAHPPADPAFYNQALLLALDPRLGEGTLARALAWLPRHHDALRLRFSRDAGGWTQAHAPLGGDGGRADFHVVDLSGLPAAARLRLLEEASGEAQRGFDLERGPLWRAVLFPLGAPGRRLLLAAHHLLVDGVSWALLQEDLESICTDLARGTAPRLPPKTTSFKEWSERLREHAGAPETLAELAFWTAAAREPLRLPVDDPGCPDDRILHESVTLALEEEATAVFLREARAEEILLSALGRTLAGWLGDGVLPVELEGHGREDVFSGVDLSRTVGWFTTLFPVWLPVVAGASPRAALEAAREALRQIPQRGLRYGVLRYLSPAGAAALARLPAAEVRLNYLGVVDRGAAAETQALLRRSAEEVGAVRSPHGRRPYLLDLVAGVGRGRLWVSWSWGEGLLRGAVMHGLAERFLDNLRELVAGGRTDSSIEDLYPLSPAQQGLLFHSLRSESAVYVEQQVHSLEGEIEAAAWDRAWQAVLARHPALRTAFRWDGLETPLQAVHRRVPLPLERLDWRGLSAAEQQGRLAELVAAGRRRPFDLRRAPLLRQTLISLDDRSHVLVWAFHHLILDGWSRALVLRDWEAAYEACRQGREPALPPAPPYHAFITWLEGRDLAAAEGFWRRELEGIERPTPLPWPGDPAHPGWGVEEVSLSPESTAALRDLARRHRLTLNTLAQGAWALLLARSSGEEDVVFGATVAGRPPDLPGIEETAGLFLNTLPVRVRGSGSEALIPWLQALQERQVEARAYEQTPLVEVQGWSAVPRDLPLFESVLVFESYPVPTGPGGAADGGGLRARLHPGAGIGHTNYPLALVVGTVPTIGLRASHDRSRLAAAAVRRLLEHLRRLLEEIAADPERALDAISFLAPAERRQILAWGNVEIAEIAESAESTESAEPFVPVHRQILEQARRAPARPALVCGGRSLAWGELAAAVASLAGRLRAAGVGAEVVVAVAAERALDTPVALLAVLAAGGVYLPLDPAQPDARLALLLADAEAAVLVAREPAASHLAALAPRPPVVIEPDAPDTPAASGEASGIGDWPHPADAACLFYTSGTTGRPKGVVVEHRHLAHTLRACRGFGWRADDRVLALAPLTFDISLFELLNPLLAGAAAVLLPREDVLDLERLAAAAAGATVLHAVPALLRELVDHILQTGGSLPGLRALFTGGDAVPADLLADARRACPSAEIRVLYGPTEGTIICTAWRLEGETAGSPLGRPLPGAVLCVVDRRGEPVPVGIPGEILLGGGGVARGYHRLPELTAERFVAHGGRRFYRTGDLARWTPEGELRFAGRLDEQVKIRGVRVEPGEVEAVLARHPGVREVVVLARAAPAGRGLRLVAWVVPAAGAAPTPEELRRFAAAHLPDALVPAAVAVLALLPRTLHGKVDRAALPEPEAAGGGRAPGTPDEERMAALWCQVLGLSSVGMEDDFFGLGGHSLLAIQVLSRVRSAFNAELSLRSLFDAPTPAGMLDAVQAARETPAALTSTPPAIGRLSRAGHRMRRDALENG